VKPSALVFLDQLRRLDRSRVERMALFAVFDATHPHLRGQPSGQEILRALLDELASDAVIVLPRGKGGWDDAQSPPLPRWVRVLPAEVAADAWPPSEIAWHPVLEFARRLPACTRAERRLLLSAQSFLASISEHEPTLTVRERSLRLLGDDKALEQLASGRLFGEGRLSLELLRCRATALPFVFREFDVGDVALIIENKDSWHSACAARARVPCRVRWIVFGGGDAILRTLPSFSGWPLPPREILYFGDLDGRGLGILVRLLEEAHLLRLVAPRGVGPLYAQMLACCTAPCRGTPVPDAERRARLVAPLPASLVRWGEEILLEGERIPQEWITESDFAAWMERGALASMEDDGACLA
jgi:hypothetical protein